MKSGIFSSHSSSWRFEESSKLSIVPAVRDCKFRAILKNWSTAAGFIICGPAESTPANWG
jgi:hypothetical protein